MLYLSLPHYHSLSLSCPYIQTSIKSTSITLVWGRNFVLLPSLLMTALAPLPIAVAMQLALCLAAGLRVGDFEFDFDFDLFNNLAAAAAVEANKPCGKL